MAAALETVGLEKHFGGLTAVAGLSLKIEKGARHALIGPNGAGKTTDRKSTRLNSSHLTQSRMPSSA